MGLSEAKFNLNTQQQLVDVRNNTTKATTTKFTFNKKKRPEATNPRTPGNLGVENKEKDSAEPEPISWN